MKIGWLDDPAQDIIGGAALSSATLQENAPEGIEIVPCPNVDVDPDCDAYVIQNCTTYTAMDLIPVLSGKRIIKSIRDYWEFGDWQLRSWLSVHASVFIFNSPLHLESFDHPVYVPTEICPPPVDVKRFQEANDSSPDSDRRGIVWIGQMFPHKGVVPAIEWARDNGEIVDFYGKGPEARHVRINPERARYCGQIFYDDVPETLSRYSRFLFLPVWIEPFGRTYVEALFAGCDMITNDRIGAKYWVEERPGDLYRPIDLFWEIVEKYV